MASGSKLWFLGQPAPPNYVAGLGRGATGFTTRSDIGPARTAESGPPEERNAYLAGRQNTNKRDAEAEAEAEEEHEREVTGRNVDEGAMFTSGPYDAEDEEADNVWEAIDERMDSRRKRRREERLQRELEEYRKSRPKIQQKFADLKPELASVSYEEWNAIPDIGDYSLRYKPKQQTFTPAPDTLLERARQESQYAAVLDEQQQRYGGLGGGGSSSSGTASSMLNPINQDLTLMGEARKTMLNLHLQSKADSVTGQTVVDPKGYLTDLNSRKITSEAEVGDMKRALLLLQSVVTTNPKHAPGWIAIARLHELGGKLVTARRMIEKACDLCGDSEDVWLEAARLHPPDMARSILARAVKRAPKSVAIWMQAAVLADEGESRRRILRKALEFVPNSVRLWRAAVELESADEARVLLQRAVQCVPTSVEMWLALARLETYDNARAVLNQARLAIPTEPSIWITAAKLEEANGNLPLVDKLLARAIRELAKNGVVLKREDWLREAELAEQSRAPETCAAIVRHSIALGLEDEDRKDTWIDDARHCVERGSIQTARAIYANALTVFPGKKRLWLLNAELEKAHGTAESLEQLLKKAVRYCPQAEILWLMGAKEKWLASDVDGARLILKEAFKANPNSEQIWLAAVKLENENHEPVRARALLARAREKAGTQRVWMKSAKLERELGDAEQERVLLDEALLSYPDYDKLWLMRAQWDERQATATTSATNGTTTTTAAADATTANGSKSTTAALSTSEQAAKYHEARQRYKQALKQCPNSLALWCSASRLEERLGAAATARSLLEKARLRNPKSPELWLEAIRVEMRDDKPKMAHALLARALQDCPTSGILWAEAIELEPLAKQKTRAVDALKKCDNDVYVMTAVAKVFWRSRRVDKARGWFNRAVTVDPDIGDAWALFYKFELQHGTTEQQQEVISRCKDSEPCHGEKWCSVSKALGNEHLSIEQVLKKVALIV